MKKQLMVVALLALAACSRNPDPEYAPDSDDAAPVVVAPAPDPAPPAEAAASARLSEEETYRLGREAVALLFANNMTELWPRFDADVQAQAQSPENFSAMVTQILSQTGAEMNVVEEEVIADDPALSIYRRRGHYLAIGMDANLFVAFNADGTIAGINIQPAE